MEATVSEIAGGPVDPPPPLLLKGVGTKGLVKEGLTNDISSHHVLRHCVVSLRRNYPTVLAVLFCVIFTFLMFCVLHIIAFKTHMLNVSFM